MARIRRKLKPSIAEVVRAEMKRQGVTRAQLARECRVSRSDLSRWLSGERSIRVALAEQVMSYLGIRVQPPGD